MSDTVDRVRKVTAGILKIDTEGIGGDSQFVRDLGAASIQQVELIAAFEDEFGIEMDEDETSTIVTVSDAATLVDSVIARQQK